ncbi:MAG: FAD:protein FMN transferase [Dechloromonas sp.]|uniref:FAD:protein FMN transferase n=1 Tax=Candidatus Dechloromonas phosphorivorans TaxID=2899244 RepID=A0A9D7LUZ8_9RHOO|nr:FAD:protein FMN transferase [Candidatus Dechloromonas phosphorivorans]
MPGWQQGRASPTSPSPDGRSAVATPGRPRLWRLPERRRTDRAANILRSQGIDNALINIGGNVMALGSKQGRNGGSASSTAPAPGLIATVELAGGEAIGTSGDYQRFSRWTASATRTCLTRERAIRSPTPQAVTVLIPTGAKVGTFSDATSKLLFIAGPDGWREMAKKMGIGLVLRVEPRRAGICHRGDEPAAEFAGKRPAITIVPR